MTKLKIGLDVSPLYSGDKIRGVGFYTKRLLKEIKKLRSLEIRELKNKAEIKKADYDLLHIPYFQPYFFTLPFIKRKPVVVSIHDLIPVKYPDHYPPGIKGKIRWQIQKKLLKKVDFIITDSFASKYDIADLAGYPQDRIYVTYLAAGEEFEKLEIRNLKLEIKRKYCLPDTFVLYVGDVNWNKNIPRLVRACEKVKVPLVIVGKQAAAKNFDKKHPENRDLVWLQNYFENWNLKIGNSRLLNLVGYVSTEDLVAIYNLAAVYCQPSFDEGFGLPVLEAMACGCPVVSSNCGSLPEIAGDAAEIVEPTVEGLTAGIKKVINNKNLREKLSKLGLERVKEFSWRKAAEQTEFVYKLALDKIF